MEWRHPEITQAIRAALAEDVGPGDITTEACVPAEARGQGVFLARQPLVLAGIELLPEIYETLGGVDRLDVVHKSGDAVEADEQVARVEGRLRALLTAERVSLNFLQHLSGVATLARQFAQAVEGTGCRVLDTRKTTPGLRRLEKLAVAAGGASNHRFGLYDAILIKNNHITAAGGIRAAMEAARRAGKPVEIEVRTDAGIDEALACGADHLLLDNFSVAEVRDAVRRIAGRARVELSGGITLQTVRAYAEAGADFVSAGALTHSAPAVDLSFRVL
ncbi:MAG TPA: carboxylating nicotinate-nucleotide diphosphorylase [Bryobacterales bacterium]|nr:carboxylating nicotinate-nucleotide diphosphorylase [Bryobacterales bacterium]